METIQANTAAAEITSTEVSHVGAFAVEGLANAFARLQQNGNTADLPAAIAQAAEASPGTGYAFASIAQ